MRQKQKKASLRTGILILVFSCGVLPILLISFINAYITNRNTTRHVNQIISDSIDNAVGTLRRDLDDVVESSLAASYVPTVRAAYSAYLRGNDAYALYTQVTAFLSEHYSNSSRLRGAYLLFTGEAPDYLFYSVNPNLVDYSEIEAFYKDGAGEAALAMAEQLGSGVAFLQSGGRLFMVRALSLLGAQYQNYAVLVLEINHPLLFETLESLPWVQAANLSIGGTGVYLGEPLEAMGLPAGETPRGSLLVQGQVASAHYSLQFSVLADTAPLLHSAGASLLPIFALALTSIPLAFILYGYFRRKIDRPLHEMARLAHSIEGGAFGEQIELARLNSAETHDLGLCMNAMSTRLETQFEHIYREELALRDAEIQALQSQINPHFLGNTLEIINWEARLAGNEKVSRMLESLSTMLEGALDRKKRPVVRLSEELVYINSYLYIIKERLGQRLEVVQEVDEALLGWNVPRLILQPIVENAVEHGISEQEHGRIVIRAVQREPGWMYLEVENDTPLSPSDEQSIARLLGPQGEAAESSLNVGIRNVHLRLRLMYGSESGLSVKTTKKGATVSSMRIGAAPEYQV